MAALEEPDQQTLSVVVVGDFNPSIFQPLWFSANDLVAKEEADDAEIAIIHRKFASFKIGGMDVTVDDSRLGITTSESPRGPILRDLAVGTLAVLEHTPLKAIGLNVDSLFHMPTSDAWHAVGDTLVPKPSWKKILDKPGMQQVIVQGKREDCRADALHLRVQPASDHGVLVAINQHYQLETDERSDVRKRHAEAIRVLSEDWTPFLSYARRVWDAVLGPRSNGDSGVER